MPPFMSWFSSFVLAIGTSTALVSVTAAQVTFREIPSDYQLIPREGEARTATFELAGTVTAGAGTRLSATLATADGTVVFEGERALDFSGGGAADFSLAVDIPVARANHQLTVALDGVPVATADSLVAGDVYLVNGQSNAEGLVAIDQRDHDRFNRGERYIGGGWSEIKFSNAGLWAGRIAKVLAERRDAPVAIFNFAAGAQTISYFRRDAPGSDNFEASRALLDARGVGARARALLWFQGESDAFTYSAERYRREMDALFDEYGEGFGVSRFYAYQVRTFSCGGNRPNVMEGQRRLNGERDDFDLMSTMNAIHSDDLCHYVYAGGYEALGNRLADLIDYRERGVGSELALAPDVDSARVTGPREISVYFDTYGAGLAVTGNPYGEFVAEGLDLRPTGGRVEGDRLVLTFGADVSGATGITYLSHEGPANDYVHSTTGVGVLTFYDYSFIPGDGAPGALPDARVGIRSPTRVLEVGALWSATVTLYNDGASTLRDVGVLIYTPPGAGYVGGSESVPSAGVFTPFDSLWRVPRVPPRDSQTLLLNYFTIEPAGEKVIHAQVASAESRDPDSAPGRRLDGVVAEDDEARIVINARERDCVLAVAPGSIRTAPAGEDGVDLLVVFDVESHPATAVTVQPQGSPQLEFAAGVPVAFTVRDYVSALDADGRLAVNITKSTDATCATGLRLDVAGAGGVSDLTPARGASTLRIAPNPVVRGATLRLSGGETSAAGLEVYDALGRLVAALPGAPGPEFVYTSDLPAGTYVAVWGEARATFVVVE